MKKIFVIMFVLILIFSLSACRGKNEEPAPSEPVLSNDNNSTGDEADTNKSKDIEDDQDQKAYAQAYIEKINEYESEEDGFEYDLIYLDEDDIPELAAGRTGYNVSVYSFFSGVLYTIMDDWAYGAMGNAGYEYIPKKNVIRNYNSDLAGAIVYEAYYQIDENYELQLYYDEVLSIWMFKDLNENYMMDEGEYNDTDLYYYFGEKEISQEEYNSYLIVGDYESICGRESASTIIAHLESI